MQFRCKNTNSVLYSGPYKTTHEFVAAFVPTNFNYETKEVEEFAKRSADSVEPEYFDNEIATIAKALLSQSDWVVTRATERGESISAEWKAYRDQLRALVDHVNNGEDAIFPVKPE